MESIHTHLCLVICAILIAGCSATIVPPSAVPSDGVTIAVMDYGRHSSIVLPDSDAHGCVEFAFGDWNWFAAGNNSFRDAVEALFYSKGSTLGRRFYTNSTAEQGLAWELGAQRAVQIAVDRQRMIVLRGSLDARYESRENREVYNDNMGLWFVPYHERYGGWHNCNHVTARWLREMGCRTRGWAYWSRFKLAKRR